MEEIKTDLKAKINLAHTHLQEELSSLRSGRANAALLDKIKVDVYGQTMPINQLATVSVPETSQLIVQPWDKANLVSLEKAIVMADLGLSVVNEGDKLRLTIPPMSNERREELVKIAQKQAEDTKISVRNLRRDALEDLDKQAKAGGISEDEIERYKKNIQITIDSAVTEVDKILGKKSEELRTV